MCVPLGESGSGFLICGVLFEQIHLQINIWVLSFFFQNKIEKGLAMSTNVLHKMQKLKGK